MQYDDPLAVRTGDNSLNFFSRTSHSGSLLGLLPEVTSSFLVFDSEHSVTELLLSRALSFETHSHWILGNLVTIYYYSKRNWKHSCSSSSEHFCGYKSNEGPYKCSILLLLLLLLLLPPSHLLPHQVYRPNSRSCRTWEHIPTSHWAQSQPLSAKLTEWGHSHPLSTSYNGNQHYSSTFLKCHYIFCEPTYDTPRKRLSCRQLPSCKHHMEALQNPQPDIGLISVEDVITKNMVYPTYLFLVMSEQIAGICIQKSYSML